MHIYSVTQDGKVRQYLLNQISGLVNSNIVAFDPGVSTVVILLRASTPDQPSGAPNSFFLAFFDYDGEFQDYTKLNVRFAPSNVAQFGNDQFLVFGMDQETGQPKFVIVDNNGDVVRNLQPDAITPQGESLTNQLQSLPFTGMKPKDMPRSEQIYAALSLFRSAHWNRGLLLLMPGSDPQVIELLHSGEIHQVPIKLPKSQVADSVLTSKYNWYVRTYIPNPGHESQTFLYKVNPETGALVGRIDTSGVPPTSIACATDSGFDAFRWLNHKAYLLTGSFQ